QRVTVEFASGPPPAWTCPSIRTPDRCCANPSVLAAVTAPNATSTPNQIVLAMLMVRSLQCIMMREPTVWSQYEPFASTQTELVGDGISLQGEAMDDQREERWKRIFARLRAKAGASPVSEPHGSRVVLSCSHVPTG